MDDGIDAVERDFVDIADVTLGDRQLGMRLKKVAKPLGIQHFNCIAALEQFRNQYCPFVTTTAGNQYFHISPIIYSKN